jgi:adenylate kinase
MTWAVGVFGVTGIGKSTLLDAHVARTPSDRHVGGSSVVKAIIAPHTVWDLDGWPPERQEAVRGESIRRLRLMRAETPRHLLVAGHFSLRNRTSGALESILTSDDHAFFDALVHVDGTADAVLAQTGRDSRQRHGQDLESVLAHLAFERSLADTTARQMGVPMVRISAPSLEERLVQLSEFLEHLERKDEE